MYNEFMLLCLSMRSVCHIDDIGILIDMAKETKIYMLYISVLFHSFCAYVILEGH